MLCRNGDHRSNSVWVNVASPSCVLSTASSPMMLRCLAAAGEVSRQQTLPNRAARLLHTVWLQQQVPCLITSICQEQALHTNAACSSLKQDSRLPQPQQPLHTPMSSPPDRPRLLQRQHSSSQCSDGSSHRWQQAGTSSFLQQPPRLTSSLQQHGGQQQLAHGYSSLAAAAHYHARHSGVGGSMDGTWQHKQLPHTPG